MGLSEMRWDAYRTNVCKAQGLFEMTEEECENTNLFCVESIGNREDYDPRAFIEDCVSEYTNDILVGCDGPAGEYYACREALVQDSVEIFSEIDLSALTCADASTQAVFDALAPVFEAPYPQRCSESAQACFESE